MLVFFLTALFTNWLVPVYVLLNLFTLVFYPQLILIVFILVPKGLLQLVVSLKMEVNLCGNIYPLLTSFIYDSR